MLKNLQYFVKIWLHVPKLSNIDRRTNLQTDGQDYLIGVPKTFLKKGGVGRHEASGRLEYGGASLFNRFLTFVFDISVLEEEASAYVVSKR